MLLAPNGLKFANLYIYSKSLHQAKYRYLEKIMAGVEEDIGYHTFSNNEEIIKPEDTPAHSIMDFDDIAMENQNVVKDFFLAVDTIVWIVFICVNRILKYQNTW